MKKLHCLLLVTSSVKELKIHATKKYKSIIKKKKKEHDTTVLLAKPKLDSIEVFNRCKY